MKRKTNAGIVFFLTLIMLIGMFPTTVSAANNEAVLTSVYHSSAVSAVNVTGSKTATLTVAHNYAYETVDLSNGLDIGFSSAVYTFASAGFSSGSVATVGGSPVAMTVTYQKINDETPYTTQYDIFVVRASGAAPSFSGTVSKTVSLGSLITFAPADFTAKYAKNDGGTLEAIAITGSHPTFGSLKLGTANYASGQKVGMSDIEDGKLTFAATKAGTVSYIVKAYAQNDPQTAIGSVTLTITIRPAGEAGTVSYQTAKNTPVTLQTADFTNAFASSAGGSLSYVMFALPPASQGKLYYSYRAAGDYDSIVFADTKYYRTVLPDISRITFMPAANYTGEVTISYKAYNTEDAVFGGGKLVITVNGGGTGASASAKDITYKTKEDTPVSLDASDFSTACQKATGKALSHVVFTLPLSSGELYYDYESPSDYGSVVSSDTEYYKNKSPYLSDIDFVPDSGFTGTATISYTGYTKEGGSYTGKVKISVDEKKDDRNKNGGYGYFKDIGSDFGWAMDPIYYLYNRRIVNGYKTGYYNPRASISRGDFMLMLCRAFNLSASFDDNFSDVGRDSYYYDAIGIGRKLGIGRGSNGRFNPNASLTREDAMVLILRALEAAGISLSGEGYGEELDSFSDYGSVSDYAYDACTIMVKAKIVQGSGRKLNPRGSISRAEMAVMLYRILEI